MASHTHRDERTDDWPEVSFGSLYAVPSRNGVYKTEEFHGRGCRVVNMGEMFGYDFISDQEMSLVQLSAAELTASALQDGDLLFGRRSIVEAGAGKCSLVVSPQSTLTFESSIIRSRLRTEAATPLFYYYFFQSPPGRRRVRGIVSGTNVKGIRGSELRGLTVPLPSQSEQKAIAAALSDVDALLGALDRLIAKKRDFKQAAMQQLLTGQTRLPGFSGKWETKRLGDALERVIGGGTPSRDNPDYWGGSIPWATVKDFATFHPTGTQEGITAEGLRNSASNLIPRGTLITSTRMALGRAVVFEVDVAINQDLKALIVKDGQIVDFLRHWFSLKARKIDEMGSGSTVKGISVSDLKGLEFALVREDEQVAIANVLSDMDTEIAALEQRRDKTRLLKQGMMQELLTGRTRLV